VVVAGFPNHGFGGSSKQEQIPWNLNLIPPSDRWVDARASTVDSGPLAVEYRKTTNYGNSLFLSKNSLLLAAKFPVMAN
jgi:hypothetical protein